MPTFDSRYSEAAKYITRDSLPTANDDETLGYSPGLIWLATTDNSVWECVSAVAGAARWVQGGGGSGNNLWENPNPCTVTIGGVPAGTSFPIGNTIQQTLQQMFYPYQGPAFTSFGLNGIAGTLEIGFAIPAVQQYNWSTSSSSNVQPNSISVADQTSGNTVLGSSLPNTGSATLTNPNGQIRKLTVATHTYQIAALNTNLVPFSRTATYQWRWRLFFGTSTSPILTGPQIVALQGSVLSAGLAGTYSTPAGGYKYIGFADIGGQITQIKDANTQFGVPLATATDHPSFSNVDSGGYAYAIVSVTNQYGVVQNYRLYRTKNTLGGALTVQVT